MLNPNNDWKKEPPPMKKVETCTSSKCEKNLHNFKRNMRKKVNKGKSYRNGSCTSCGVNLIDWKKIDKRDPNNTEYLFSSLQLELIRNRFWHKPFDDKALKKITGKTISKLKKDVKVILEKALRLPSGDQFRDGTQTKKEGNVIFYAQHATATCCRKCLEEWYNIDKTQKLSEKNLNYLVQIVMIFLKKRLPDLNNGSYN